MKFLTKRLFLVILYWLLFAFSGSTQHYDWNLNAQVIKGFILKHNEYVAHLAVSNPSGFEISMQQQLNGSRDWESLYNKPIVNYGLSYYDLHNPKLGKLIIGSAAMDIPLFKKEKASFYFRVGTGIVFATNPYNRETNNQNNMVTSRYSVLLQPRLIFSYQLSDKFTITPSLNITHASNGAQRAPNRGINIVTANLGASYKIISRKDEVIEEEIRTSVYDYKLYLIGSWGRNTRTLQVRQPKPFYNLIAYGQKYLNKKSDIGLGIEYFHSLGLKEQIATDWFLVNSTDPIPDFRRVALVAGHDLKFGSLYLTTQIGFYVYDPSKKNLFTYQRYGLKYHFHEHILGQLSFKTHAATAEQVEFGLGWRF
ncbi:hypothetical protein GCM10027429_16340 [Marivirga atlantica]|uniref:Acyloxyacyl hydrolase n=1 Tax=Marivirga atlantica TaxID=1548457 RepID=A0A937AAE7_9BACT|nr:acyloxyacyl hydrolase [Marivirga atlantica]MBL0765251.1 acyloxyacyl hydrolase [Marivirga atlantica]